MTTSRSTRASLPRWIVLLALLAAAGAPGIAAAGSEGVAPGDTTEALEVSQAARIPGLRGRPDLLQHASLAFAIGVGAGVLTEEPGAAAGVSLSLGIAKEFSDSRFDRADLAADLVGAALAAAVTWWISR